MWAQNPVEGAEENELMLGSMQQQTDGKVQHFKNSQDVALNLS